MKLLDGLRASNETLAYRPDMRLLRAGLDRYDSLSPLFRSHIDMGMDYLVNWVRFAVAEGAMPSKYVSFIQHIDSAEGDQNLALRRRSAPQARTANQEAIYSVLEHANNTVEDGLRSHDLFTESAFRYITEHHTLGNLASHFGFEKPIEMLGAGTSAADARDHSIGSLSIVFDEAYFYRPQVHMDCRLQMGGYIFVVMAEGNTTLSTLNFFQMIAQEFYNTALLWDYDSVQQGSDSADVFQHQGQVMGMRQLGHLPFDHRSPREEDFQHVISRLRAEPNLSVVIEVNGGDRSPFVPPIESHGPNFSILSNKPIVPVYVKNDRVVVDAEGYPTGTVQPVINLGVPLRPSGHNVASLTEGIESFYARVGRPPLKDAVAQESVPK